MGKNSFNVALLIIFLFKLNQHALAGSISQSTHGICSPTIANIIGNATILCRDEKALKALEKLNNQLEILTLNDQEKTSIIATQSNTIFRLLVQKSKSKTPSRYDKALDALASGQRELASQLLNEAIDEAEINLSKQREKIIKLYSEKGALWFATNTDKAINAYLRIVELDSKYLHALNKLGHLYYRIGELDKAVSSYTALGTISNDQEWLAKSYGNLGMVYQAQGDLKKAIKYYQKALAINEALGHNEGIAIQYGNLGVAYQTQSNLEKALKLYQKALAINKVLDSPAGIASDYGNLGNLHQMQGNLEQAIEYYQKSLSINETLDHQEGMAIQYGNLGAVNKTQGNWNKALELYKKALVINEALGRKEGIAIQYSNLGTVNQSQGDSEKARLYWEKSLSLFESIGAKRKVRLVQSWLDST